MKQNNKTPFQHPITLFIAVSVPRYWKEKSKQQREWPARVSHSLKHQQLVLLFKLFLPDYKNALLLRLISFTVHGRIRDNCYGQITAEDNWLKFLTFVLKLRQKQKKPQTWNWSKRRSNPVLQSVMLSQLQSNIPDDFGWLRLMYCSSHRFMYW